VHAKVKPTKFVLRDFQPQDFGTVWLLDQICFTRGIAYSKDELAFFIRQPKSFTVVAEAYEQICGFIVVERAKKDVARVITIDVHPEQRRDGLGSLLMQAAEERARGEAAARVVLEVAVDNAPAIAFYKRHGYSVVGTIPRYYLGSLDALRMEKSLSSQ
jgi:ribosomal-protein-alanine N-acetyltransferase